MSAYDPKRTLLQRLDYCDLAASRAHRADEQSLEMDYACFRRGADPAGHLHDPRREWRYGLRVLSAVSADVVGVGAFSTNPHFPAASSASGGPFSRACSRD
jgi:hypothetical protein